MVCGGQEGRVQNAWKHEKKSVNIAATKRTPHRPVSIDTHVSKIHFILEEKLINIDV
jgi:hypothetical protein